MLTRKLGRKKAHRTHMLRNLAASVILHEKVETTEAKAKEVKRIVEKSITMAKKQTLAARRQLAGRYFDDAVVAKLYDELATRYATRTSGYTRALRTGVRYGDAGATMILTLIPAEKVEPTAKASKLMTAKPVPTVEPAPEENNDANK